MLFLKGSCSLCPDWKVGIGNALRPQAWVEATESGAEAAQAAAEAERPLAAGLPLPGTGGSAGLVGGAGAQDRLQPPGGESDAWFWSKQPSSGQLQE